MIQVEIPDNAVYDRPGLAKLLGLSDRAIGREIRHGRLRAHLRVGRQWFFANDVRAWLGSQVFQPSNPDHADKILGIEE